MSIAAYIIFCLLVAFFASHRGRSPILWGIIALVISPVVAAIVLAIMKDLTSEQRIEKAGLDTDRLRERVAVSEQEIHHRMDHMEQRLDRVDGGQAARVEGEWKEALPEKQEPLSEETEPVYCSQCGEVIPDGAAFCPHCGARQH